MAVFLDSPGRSPFVVREWAAWLTQMVAVSIPSVEFTVNLVLVDDACIAELNARALGCPGPTNVISFPAPDFVEGSPAEIYLSLDSLRRECCLYGQALDTHAKRLLAHGLAHALGYDHGPEMDALTSDMLRQVK